MIDGLGMVTDAVIRVENLGKKYQIRANRDARYVALRDVLADGARSLWRRLLRKPGNGTRRTHEDVWALNDASFAVESGECVGIIGRNGAGKSTLLKLLSRITEPTTGRFRLRGRVASLLEVGTGFHPELTGRENIYLNGAILGMGKREIKKKFDRIVDFAETAKFLDTPVKYYSSGMYVRLAFAVAAHLDPEILIVDEVLAVGDYAFQKKCLGRMSEVAHDNRTVLFVSHNLNALRSLCSRGIVLEAGRVVLDAPIDRAAEYYLASRPGVYHVGEKNLRNRMERATGAARFEEVRARDATGQERWTFRSGETLFLSVAVKVLEPVRNMGLYVAIKSGGTRETLTTIKEVLSEKEVPAGSQFTVTVTLPDICLRPGDYSLYIWLGDKECSNNYDVIDENVSLPLLSITSDEQHPQKTAGCFSLAARVELTPTN